LPWGSPAGTDGGVIGFGQEARDPPARREAEEALRQSEERFRLAIASVKDYAIFMLDADGRVETWNSGAEIAKGYRAAEVVGRHISVFYTPEDAAAGKPQQLLRRAAEEGRVEDEGWRVRKDGSRFWADVVITALRSPRGELVGYCKVTRDLTERRQAEQNLRRLAEEQAARTATEETLHGMRFLVHASKALSSTLEYEATLAAVARLVVPALADNCVVDVVEGDGTVRRAAEAAADPRKEALLRELRRFPPTAERPSPVIEALTTGKTVFIPELDAAALDALKVGDEHARIIREIAPRSSVTVPMWNRGRVLGALTFGMAESGRTYDPADVELAEELGRRAGAALDNAMLFRDRERLYEAERTARTEAAVLYRLADAVAHAETLEQVFDAALDAIGEALGTPRSAILLFDAEGVMRFRASRGLSERYRAAVDGHSPWTPYATEPEPVLVEDARTDPEMARFLEVFEVEQVRSLGFFPLVVSGRLIGKFMAYYPEPHAFTDPEKRVAAAVARNIALAVEKQASHDERDRFLGIVGHDLRNPLGAISMSANALLRRDLGEGEARTVRRIVSSAERMERLIAQLLTFAQARQGGGVPLRIATVDLGAIARHVVDELEAAHPERLVLLSEDGDLGGFWDPDRLAEVLSNLVGNAIQHGDESPVHVRLSAEPERVLLEIQNRGPTIPADLQPRLFDPFRRGGSSDRRKAGSVGLGLYISRELVRAHGGTIGVRSTEADGTVFSVELPRRPPRDGRSP
jgi:PAS domain S-box-containing protein